MSEPIDAVLWDYGGVFTPSPFGAAADMAEAAGVSGEDLLAAIFGPYDRDTDHPWHRLERGEIAFELARNEIIALGQERQLDSDPLKLFMAIGARGGLHVEVVEVARRVRAAGRKNAMITNNAHEFREHWRKSLPLDELFDLVVDSSEVAMRKPDPRIFTHTLEVIGVVPERAVFLDDFPGNLRAAEALGIRTILVERDPAAAMAELEALL